MAPTAVSTESLEPRFAVLAVHGRANSGKTTLAEALVTGPLPRTRHTVQRLRVSFAGPIKSLAERLLGWTGDKTAYKNPDGSLDLNRGRGALIGVGNSLRATYPDIWANLAVHQIQRRTWQLTDKGVAMALPVPFSLFVIDDLRLLNEAVVLRQAFGSNLRFIKIERANQLTGIPDATEAGLDGFSEWSYDLDNNGTLEMLQQHAADILDKTLPV